MVLSNRVHKKNIMATLSEIEYLSFGILEWTFVSDIIKPFCTEKKVKSLFDSEDPDEIPWSKVFYQGLHRSTVAKW